MATDDSLNSSCISSVEDCADTASSVTPLEPDAKKAVSYSGKTTAAILQELLTALNSSKAQNAADDNPRNRPNNQGNILSSSSSFDTMSMHVEPAGSYNASQEDIDDTACSEEVRVCVQSIKQEKILVC
jgi:hypothetical protein